MNTHVIDLATELWAAAQKAPNDTIEDAVNRLAHILEADRKLRGEPVYLYRRKGQDEFVTCDKSRYDELSDKPDLFETRILYDDPQPGSQSQ